MSDSSSDDLTLAAEFPPATRAQWLDLVAKMLGDARFEDKLVSSTYDGLRIEPLYARAATAVPVFARTPGADWQVLQRIDDPDPARANAQALNDLENGVTGLSLVFAGSVGSYGYGVTPAALARVLEGVRLDAISLELQPETNGVALGDLVQENRIDPQTSNIRFGFDPVGTAAVRGEPFAWRETSGRLAGAIGRLAERGFKGPFAVADGRAVHNAGGSEAQELAYALAVAIACVRALEQHGVALDDARRMIFFRLAADADQFLTVAKLRALRRLWARIEEACGLEPEPAFISAETAWRMMTRRDPYVNMLRATVATFAAGIGGADAITVLPFTAALGLPDGFARRIARNTQLILLHESNLAKVADPVAGSGGIEALTQKLCGAAWTVFQQIETVGGICAAFENGSFQADVTAVRTARERAVALRKDALTGTSDFPDLHESAVSVLDSAPATSVSRAAAPAFAPLASMRLAAPYERLREASDRMLATTGSRPKVFLANLGPLAAFTARATFAKNFFEAGGIEAVTNDGFANSSGATDLAALAAAFSASGARLACLCSSDETYEREGAAAAQALAAAGATHIYLVGRPGERWKALENAGARSFVYAGCDVLSVLERAHAILGIA